MLEPAPTILLRTADYAVLDKPTGVSTEPDRGSNPSLRDWLSEQLTKEPGTARSPHAVSRLDTPVSGAVLFALTDRGTKHFAQLEKSVDYVRSYLCLSQGQGRVPAQVSKAIGGKPAVSELREVAASAAGSPPLRLLALRPVTGRTHQLRIHAGSAGLPIVGDRRYGGAGHLATDDGRIMPLSRVLLHAHHLAFLAPDGTRQVVFAPIPSDFLAAWSWLDGNDEAWEGARKQCAASSWPASSEA